SWYGTFLHILGEAPLYPPPSRSGSVYRFLRFLLLPTFDQPLLVRISNNDAGWSIVSKTNDGLGGYSPGPRTTQMERNLNPAECEKLVQAFDRLGFWSLPVSDGSTGCDGSEWLLEAVSEGRYHVVHRWSPEGGVFAQFCELLLDFGGL